MQLFATTGFEEEKTLGLNWIEGEVIKLKLNQKNLKIPHMGWNLVSKSSESELTQGFEDFEEVRFYFVHSYFVKVANEKNSILKTSYGVEFDSAIQKDNIYGAQFHPEKSHKFGMKIFKNFASI